MSTLASQTLDRRNWKEKVTITRDLTNEYDYTNKRWKSGYYVVAVTGVTWTGGGVSTENVIVHIKAPNYGDEYDSESYGTYVASAGTVGVISFTHNTALNYGQVGPSGRANEDGTASLLEVEIELEDQDVSALSSVVTVTYTVTFNPVDPYTTFTTPNLTTQTLPLAVSKERPQDWAAVSLDESTVSAYSYCAVQLTSLTTTNKDGLFKDRAAPAQLVATTTGSKPGPVTLASHGVSKSANSSFDYKEAFTWVFAVNGGKADANVGKLQFAGGFSKLLLLSAGLVHNGFSDDKAAASFVAKTVGA